MGIGRDLHGRHKDGTEVPVEIGLNPVHTEDGLYVIGSIVDISARRDAEERLLQSQKMEAIGTLASGIAHDFNNILLGIIGHTELVASEAQLSAQNSEDLQRVLSAARRGRELVQRILTFSRHQEVERSPLNTKATVREAMGLLRASLPAAIELLAVIDAETPDILSNETLLHQVLMNLVTNAAHAMHFHGVIETELGYCKIVEERATSTGTLAPGDYCMIRVHDTGPGMEPEVAPRIFEPFYTTKGAGEGTGLGLSVVLGIVQGHGGAIHVETVIGKGTTMTVYLPAVDIQQTKTRTEKSLPQALVVDDESMLADMIAREVARLGYETTVYYSGGEALKAFRADPKWFDLVITDNNMPKLTGLAMAQEIRKLSPNVPILMTSGLSRVKPDTQGLQHITRFLPKPFTMHELLSAIKEVMQGDVDD